MNKYQEAFKKVKEACVSFDTVDELVCLKKLVDKEIPKKLIKTTLYENENHAVIVYKCPTCGEIYTSLLDKYCKECGQKFEEWI